MMEEVRLKRAVSLPLLVLYGLGTTIGAGIYALLGEVAGSAGMLAPWAFLFASLMALFPALSFAELSARYPRSAGEAVYVKEGFGLPQLALVVGLMVALAGSVSSASIINGAVGYLSEFIEPSGWLTIVSITMLLGLIAAWGVKESIMAAGLLTLVEIGGLLVVIWVSRDALTILPQELPRFFDFTGGYGLAGLLSAALLAFYAYLGFEDLVNVAEEVKGVKRNLPLAIVLTLTITTLLYLALATAAVLSVPPEALGESQAPLALVFEHSTGGGASTFISLIALFSIINGALIQMIMASRVLYGLASQGLLPRFLAYIHPHTRTPLTATLLVVAFITLLALWFPLAPLARATSVITLAIFSLVNLSLWNVKRREGKEQPQGLPRWVPATGFLLCAAFMLYGIT
ncbi:MAG TPA: amino acid permease, partial [Chromatiales bacterium]|nr:amino acid permease [Chromatiales bacterium]